MDHRHGEAAGWICAARTPAGSTVRRPDLDGRRDVPEKFQPFRISGGFFYSYHLPGSSAGQNTYAADLVNTRLIVEHILNDEKGFGYNVEIVGLHGLTWRADGHTINDGGRNGFNSLGVQPTVQYRFSDKLVGAAGVLFTVAGQNTLDAVFPNFSIYWYWSKSGKVIMR